MNTYHVGDGLSRILDLIGKKMKSSPLKPYIFT